MTTTQHFETLAALQLLDIEGAQRFAQSIAKAQELATLTGTSRWAMVWNPTTCYACIAIVNGGGLERTNFMGPMTRDEAEHWFRETVTPEAGEFSL